MIKKPLTIAVVGKGGVGKTVITTLLAKGISQLHKYKLLLIDADPNHPHLCNMTKLHPNRSLEDIRLDVIKNVQDKKYNPIKLAEQIDFNVYESMAESKSFCILSIGQPESPGCFCPSNTLLKRVLESLTRDFDIILIDCEAGLEQINRMVLRTVDIILIITDISLRSIETANSIRKIAQKFTNYRELWVIINKVKNNIKIIRNRLKELNLPVLGEISEDPNITHFDLEGKAILDLPEDSSSFIEIKNLINQLFS